MTFPIHMDELGAFVTLLRGEGFDARTDLFNGQVGLIVGPKGLDPKRLPPDTAGYFFPLWELNYSSNRSLVEARRFHDIFEARPADWKFNSPYQHRADQARIDLLHWNRSASLLGDKKLEDNIQQELIRRFPPREFPVNIDVLGGQNRTYAIVHVSNSDRGIDESAQAIPEDFIGLGGTAAAVANAADRLISELQRDGVLLRVPESRSDDRSRGTLSLRAIAHAGEDSDIRNWNQVVQYEVQGLPRGEQAWIANFGSRYRESWRVLRARNGIQTDWSGDNKSAEVALEQLQKELDTHMRHIETMKGSGTVRSNDGEEVGVRYELHVYQQEIPAGTLDNPDASVPGLKEIRGRIIPVRFFGENGLLLEMEDRRKLKFSFTDTKGAIALNQWIG